VSEQRTDDPTDAPADEQTDEHGRRAESPTDLPAKGWRDVLVRTKSEAKSDHVSLLSAGVAFFGLLALVPGLIVVVSLYGLIAERQTVKDTTKGRARPMGTRQAEVADTIGPTAEELEAARSVEHTSR
jgi:membrane protein